jgi:glycosyltransferase involved in cell wall biosynthesis
LADRRKGADLLLEGLEAARASWPGLRLLTFGRRDLTTAIPQHALGPLESDALMAAAYSAADLFVIPSREDNLPNTVLEALACGTPAVGFPHGGIPEMVRPGETGLLARAGDARDLGEQIHALLADEARRAALAEKARELAVAEYDAAVARRRYEALYERALAEGAASSPRSRT